MRSAPFCTRPALGRISFRPTSIWLWPRSSWSTCLPASGGWPRCWPEDADQYDTIIIDCQPSLGLLTLNAMVVADGVLIPVACEYLAMRAVKGILTFIKKVQGQANSQLKVIGLLPTMFDKRTRHAQETFDQLKKEFEPKVRVLDTIVYRSIRFAEAAASGESIFTYAQNIPGAEAYRELAKALVRGEL